METKIENLGLILLLLASSDNLETVNPTLYDNVKKELLNDNTKKYIKGLVFEHLCMHKKFYLEHEFNNEMKNLKKLIESFDIQLNYNEYLIKFQEVYTRVNKYHWDMCNNICKLNKFVYEYEDENLKDILKRYKLDIYNQGFGSE